MYEILSAIQMDATAWATSVLAAITAVFVVLTWWSNRMMKRSAVAAEQSARSAEAAASSADLSLRLAAMPMVFGDKLARSTKHSDRWQTGIRNVGPTTALNLVITATIPTAGVDGLKAEKTFKRVTLAALRRDTPDTVEFEDVIRKEDGEYRVEIQFGDPLGNRYQTVRYSRLGGNSSMSVAYWDEAAKPKTWRILVAELQDVF